MSGWDYLKILFYAKNDISRQIELEANLAPIIASLESNCSVLPSNSCERMYIEVTKLVFTGQVESRGRTFKRLIDQFLSLHSVMDFDLKELFNDQTLLYKMLTELPELNDYLLARVNEVDFKDIPSLLMRAITLRECAHKSLLLIYLFARFREGDVTIKEQYPALMQKEVLEANLKKLIYHENILHVLKQMIPQDRLSWTSSESLEITTIKNLINDICIYFNDGNLKVTATSIESIAHIKEMVMEAIDKFPPTDLENKSLIILHVCLHDMNVESGSRQALEQNSNSNSNSNRKNI